MRVLAYGVVDAVPVPGFGVHRPEQRAAEPKDRHARKDPFSKHRLGKITERPHDPSGVAAFMSAHSKTPYITPSMDFSSGKRVVRGRRGQQLEYAVAACSREIPIYVL